MNGQNFQDITKRAFGRFLTELGFAMESPIISGRLYQIIFGGTSHVVSVSYEPGDEVLFVMIFTRENGKLSDLDDRLKTPRLADLNSRYMHAITKEERQRNEAEFALISPRDNEEKLVLKAAKELRLVIPRYLRDKKPLGDGSNTLL